MHKPISFLLALLCIHVLALPLAADYTPIWKPGGTHKDIQSFKEGDNYSGGDFRKSYFYDSHNIIGVNLDNTNFEGSFFMAMRVENTSFRGANLRSVYADMDEMPGCDFTDADISGSNLPLNSEQLRSTKSFKNKKLVGVTIHGKNWIGDQRMDLSGISFADFDLTEMNLINSNLANGGLTGAVITRMQATGLTFDHI